MCMVCLHLLSAVDQALLWGWDAFLLFDALLYALDLGLEIVLAAATESREGGRVEVHVTGGYKRTL